MIGEDCSGCTSAIVNARRARLLRRGIFTFAASRSRTLSQGSEAAEGHLRGKKAAVRWQSHENPTPGKWFRFCPAGREFVLGFEFQGCASLGLAMYFPSLREEGRASAARTAKRGLLGNGRRSCDWPAAAQATATGEGRIL